MALSVNYWLMAEAAEFLFVGLSVSFSGFVQYPFPFLDLSGVVFSTCQMSVTVSRPLAVGCRCESRYMSKGCNNVSWMDVFLIICLVFLAFHSCIGLSICLNG